MNGVYCSPAPLELPFRTGCPVTGSSGKKKKAVGLASAKALGKDYGSHNMEAAEASVAGARRERLQASRLAIEQGD